MIALLQARLANWKIYQVAIGNVSLYRPSTDPAWHVTQWRKKWKCLPWYFGKEILEDNDVGEK